MITYGTFIGMPVTTSALNVFKPISERGESSYVAIRPWEALKKVLENTGDHVVFVVTKAQMDPFLECVKKCNLEQYLVVRQDGPTDGTRNSNYPNDPRRLRHFIFKGKGE